MKESYGYDQDAPLAGFQKRELLFSRLGGFPLIPHFLSILFLAYPALSQQPLVLNQLVFKGTHNSYISSEGCDDIGGICYSVADAPWMNHDLRQQIDDFGGWTIELDFSVNEINHVARCQVGHDGVGNPAGFVPPPFFLTDYFRQITNAHALQYRPVFIYLEKKNFGDDKYDAPAKYFPVLEAELTAVFGDKVFGPSALETFLNKNGGKYPTVPQLAGRIIPVSIPDDCETTKICTNLIFRNEKVPLCSNSAPLGLGFLQPSHVNDDGTSLNKVISSLSPGTGGIVRLDQYQADWTFNYGVPPNPIVVSNTAPAFQAVTDSVGQSWSCNGDISRGNIVGEHGTYRFPYRTVRAAVDRAAGITPDLPFEPIRTGYGWTVLLTPGKYPESVIINIPLTLKKDNALSGPVIIGR
jgi:hypothetical protein